MECIMVSCHFPLFTFPLFPFWHFLFSPFLCFPFSLFQFPSFPFYPIPFFLWLKSILYFDHLVSRKLLLWRRRKVLDWPTHSLTHNSGIMFLCTVSGCPHRNSHMSYHISYVYICATPSYYIPYPRFPILWWGWNNIWYTH